MHHLVPKDDTLQASLTKIVTAIEKEWSRGVVVRRGKNVVRGEDLYRSWGLLRRRLTRLLTDEKKRMKVPAFISTSKSLVLRPADLRIIKPDSKQKPAPAKQTLKNR